MPEKWIKIDEFRTYQSRKKNKRKIIYKGDSIYPNIPSSAEAVHNALCASIYRFSNDGPHFETEIMDSQKLAQLTTLSWHRKLCYDILAIFVL